MWCLLFKDLFSFNLPHNFIYVLFIYAFHCYFLSPLFFECSHTHTLESIIFLFVWLVFFFSHSKLWKFMIVVVIVVGSVVLFTRMKNNTKCVRIWKWHTIIMHTYAIPSDMYPRSFEIHNLWSSHIFHVCSHGPYQRFKYCVCVSVFFEIAIKICLSHHYDYCFPSQNWRMVCACAIRSIITVFITKK